MTADGLCAAHGGLVDMKAIGQRGGQRRGKKTDQPELTDRELAFAALRRSLDSGNAAAVVAAGKALIDLERSDPRSWESDAVVKQAREKFGRRIEAIAARHAAGLARAGRCPTCERSRSPSEAESLMAKGTDESVAGWIARVTASPPDQRVQRLEEEAKAKERLGQEATQCAGAPGCG